MATVQPKRHHTVLWIVIACVLAFAASFAFFAFVPPPALSQAQLNGASATDVYYRNGQKMGTINQNRQVVSLDQISPYLRNGVIAIEDHRFYEHSGVDIIGIGRALIADLTAGRIVAGGSTITQQLAKNAVVGDQESLGRKIKEAYYAMQIERLYTKDEILDFYLNQVYFGHGAYGAEQASQTFFNKSAKNLTLAQAAYLAGAVNAPSALDPLVSDPKLREQHRAQGMQRRDLVLDAMAEYGYISQQQADQAKQVTETQMHFNPHPKPVMVSTALYFVQQQLNNEVRSISPERFNVGGFKIYTTIDSSLQNTAESTYRDTFPQLQSGKEVKANFEKNPTNPAYDSAMVVLDAKSGGVRSIIGSYDFLDDPMAGLNMAYSPSAHMPPGSSIKPITVYGPAIESGKFTAASKVSDARGLKAEGGVVNNYPGEPYKTWVPITEAIAESYNVSAVWTLQQLGAQVGTTYAERFGIPLTDVDKNNVRRLALGDLDKGLNPLQMASAYTAFADNGAMHPAYVIEKVVDDSGHVLYQHHTQSKQVLQPTTAYVMQYLLHKVITEGTAAGAGFPKDWAVAGKTGTSSPPEEQSGNARASRDLWFAGYTPQLVGAAWTGMRDPKNPAGPLEASSADMAKVVAAVFKAAGQPPAFEKPTGIVEINGIPFIEGTVPNDLQQQQTLSQQVQQVLPQQQAAQQQQAAGPITGLSATVTSNGGTPAVLLQWQPVALPGTRYVVYRATQPDLADAQAIGSTYQPTYVDSTPAQAARLWYFVAAVAPDNTEISRSSAVVVTLSAAPPTIPPSQQQQPPQQQQQAVAQIALDVSLPASGKVSTVDLHWSVTGTAEPQRFEVRRNGNTIVQLPAAVHTWRDRTVQPGQAYTYQIVAVGSNGETIATSAPTEVQLPAQTQQKQAASGG